MSTAWQSRAWGVVELPRLRRYRSLLKTSPAYGSSTLLGLDREIEGRDAFRPRFLSRQVPDDVEEMLLGQSDEGPAEQRAQRQRVPSVGQDTRHGD